MDKHRYQDKEEWDSNSPCFFILINFVSQSFVQIKHENVNSLIINIFNDNYNCSCMRRINRPNVLRLEIFVDQ